jgi:aspartyl-tRNA(Asn)/glutamyl-tRNA(Gln) amidotransferase subunit C
VRRVSDRAIDDAAIRHLADLEQLTLDEATLPALREQLATIVSYVARLQEVDVSGADGWEPTPLGDAPLRPDETRPSLTAEEAVRPAAEAYAGLFRVPRVLSG